MPVGRRQVLIALSGIGAFGAGWLTSTFGPTSRLGQPAPTSAPPTASPSSAHASSVLPSTVGKLDFHEKETLWEIAIEAGRLWESAALEQTEFFEILDQKTQFPPSYLEEYRFALGNVYGPLREVGTAAEAVAAVWDGNTNRSEDYSKLRMKQFVLIEFLALHVAFGGFRQLGFDRAPGFMGKDGSYALSAMEAGAR